MKLKVTPILTGVLPRIIALLAITCALFAQTFAQTAANTQIQNQASASYSDGSGGSYSSVSNIVTVTVAKVAGLTITPDASTDPTVVPGQTGVLYNFRVTNTGNFTDQVRFLASGASAYLGGTAPATITRVVIDVDNSGTINAGDTDIKGNAADVLSANILQNGFINVLVEVSVTGTATAGQTLQVFLGDAATGGPTFDNQAADSSIHDVRTLSTGSVNGMREARGDRTSTVDNDAQLALSLAAPTGPLALGSSYNYTWQLCNTGARSASSVTLTNAPAGSNTGVFIFAPIPAGTALSASQTLPGGVTLLYSVSPVASDPITTATWTTVAPVPLSNTTRVALNVGASLANGACSPNINLNVTITTPDATNVIVEQGTAYAKNSINAQITTTSPSRTTTLLAVGSVLNGPQGQPGAVGPTNNNDDYTNKSVSTGIAGVAPGGVTTAAGSATYVNTVQNSGNANDVYTLTVTAFPAGSTVKVTVGATQVTVVNNGVATGTAIPTMSIAFGASANYTVDVSLPLGKTVLTGYDTVIRATSGNTSSATNDTIDRLFTGFLQLTKTATVANGTGVGAATDSVPGAVITFAITYQNVTASSGSGNVNLTATNIVITENGNTAPNNWATYTDHVVGATDTRGGTITGDSVGSNVLTDTVASLGPGLSGVFSFKRQIK
ncbi:MAG TPA: hypothetical protein VGO91_18520 [Pyrinomonadaceae bacterium]|jgi:hypothetical protein|nr:hypothetical protein [Pyrinomonadaceae bacterium]